MNDLSGADARLVLSEPELDAAIELLIVANASLWSAADGAIASLAGAASRLGLGHWRVAFLLRRRPGLGVSDLAELTGLSKQAVSRSLRDLETAGLVEKSKGEDGRRRPSNLTVAGDAFEAGVAERLRTTLADAYRAGGIQHAAAARRIWAALAGARGRRRPARLKAGEGAS